MSTPETMEDEETALARLLGNDTVATPAALNAGLRWVLAKVRQELAGRPAAGAQEWARPGDIASRYGMSQKAVFPWLRRLKELGKVRVHIPLSGKGDKGDTFYCLADIDAAFAENAERFKNE